MRIAITSFLLFCASFLGEAHAYIDPGTGSFVVQMLLATILGGLFTIRLWFDSVKLFFMRLMGKVPASDESEKSDEE